MNKQALGHALGLEAMTHHKERVARILNAVYRYLDDKQEQSTRSCVPLLMLAREERLIAMEILGDEGPDPDRVML